MTDELITDLAKLGSARVTSRTSVMRYKGTKKGIREIGRELNVDAVVEGTVTRSGDRVRITAQLIQVATDMHLWAETYERDVREVLRLQSEVATDIARRISSVVKPLDQPRTREPAGLRPLSQRTRLLLPLHRSGLATVHRALQPAPSKRIRTSRPPIPASPTPISSPAPTAPFPPRKR